MTRQANKWLVLCVTALGALFSTINASSIAIANPVLAAEFSLTQNDVQWVTTLYLIIVTALTLLAGRIGDRIGSNRVYITGLVVFTLGSLACSLAGTLVLLLIGRSVQAIGAAMVLATGMGLVSSVFPPQQRGMGIGLMVLMVGLGNTIGPPLGGFILANGSWPLIFFINVPMGVVSVALAIAWLRFTGRPQRDKEPLDLLGSVLLAALIAALIVSMNGRFAGSIWFLAVVVLLLPLFIIVERRHTAPLLDFVLLRNRRFSIGNLITLFSYSAMMAVSFQLPFFLQDIWHLSVDVAGFLMMVMALSMGITAPLAGILSDRVGALRVMPPALVLSVVAQALALFFVPEPSLPLFIVYMALIGCGMGILNTPNNSEVMAAAGREKSGYASGFVAANRNLAFCLGTAVSAGLFSLMSGAGTLVGAAAPDVGQLLSAFKGIALLALVLTTASALLSIYLLLRERHSPTKPDSSTPAGPDSSNEPRG
ncbi:MAG: MFS transporter [Coriobacteriales bacterium]|nr:MFS transporter [Coriobacteriales bacterium]